MTRTLLVLDVPFDDAALLGRVPWRFPANRIAVERERLGLSPIHPLLHWKVPPPPPTWLTPALIVKIFELALSEECAAGTDPTPGDDRDLILAA